MITVMAKNIEHLSSIIEAKKAEGYKFFYRGYDESSKCFYAVLGGIK
jgi:hypothetical protein